MFFGRNRITRALLRFVRRALFEANACENILGHLQFSIGNLPVFQRLDSAGDACRIPAGGI